MASSGGLWVPYGGCSRSMQLSWQPAWPSLLAGPPVAGIEQQCCCDKHLQHITVAVVVAGVAFALGGLPSCWVLNWLGRRDEQFQEINACIGLGTLTGAGE